MATKSFNCRYALSVFTMIVLFVLGGLNASAVTMVGGQASRIAKDDTGRVWGLARPDNSYERLCVLQDESWRRVDFSPLPGDWASNFMSIERLGDGWVYCMWRGADDKDIYVTRHRGEVSESVAHVQGKLDKVREVFVDLTNGDVWMTGPRVIYRIPKDGEFKPVKFFQSDAYHPRQQDGEVYYRAPMLFFDPELGVWAWGKAWPGPQSDPVLRGLCRLQGEEVEHHPSIEGVPDKPFTALQRAHDSTYWVGVTGEGLYEIDLKTLKGKKLEGPEPEAFRFPIQIRALDGELYVLARPRWSAAGWNRNEAALWQFTGESFKKVMSDLWCYSESPLLKTKEGLWLGTEPEALWLAPADGGEPIHVDWRRGFPLRRVTYLESLNDGRLMANKQWGQDATTAVISPAEILVEPSIAPNIEVFDTWGRPVQGEDKRIWMVLRDSPDSLSVWDGEQWVRHEIPAECPRDEDTTTVACPRDIMMDASSRVWLWFWRIDGSRCCEDADGPVAAFDTQNETWRYWPTFLEAMEAQRARRSEFRFTSNESFMPVFCEDGRMAFRFHEPWKVYYLGRVSDAVKAALPTAKDQYAPAWRAHPGPDGMEWYGFLYHDFGGGEIEGMTFTESGKLSVSTTVQDYSAGTQSKETWELDEQAGWRKVEYRPYPNLRAENWQKVHEMFQDPQPRSPNAVVQDSHGTYWHWYLKNGQLYKQGLGKTAPQFLPGERHPLTPEEGVQNLLVDPKGNVIFDANYAQEYMILKPRLPLPETQLAVEYKSPDAVTVEMTSKAGGEPWFVWRLDEGKWSDASKTAEVSFTDLFAGEHQFEAFALDERLQVEETPKIAKIEVKAASEQQVADWIADLSSKDYEAREAAVKALVRAGKVVLPDLQKARESADDDLKWWLEAAIEKLK